MSIVRKVLVTGDFELPQDWKSLDAEIIHIKSPRGMTEIHKALKDVDAYVIGGPEYLDEQSMALAPRLLTVVVLGTGTSSFVDLEAATRRRLKVFNTPGINADSVAEFTAAMVVACSSRIFASVRGVHQGTEWSQRPRQSLADMKIGILGLGNIGQALAHKLKALGAQNLFYTGRARKLEIEQPLGLRFLTPLELFQMADVVSIHLTYAPETHHWVNSKAFEVAKPDQVLLNLSNPKIVDPHAWRDFLLRNRDASGFLDGYYREWESNRGLEHDPEGLLALENFTASSHIAAQEKNAITRVLAQALLRLKRETKSSSPSFN